MTLEEKAGLMVGPSLPMGPGGTPSEQPVYGVNQFSGGPAALVSPGTGKLPFELPSSMDAVRAQLEDVPHDSKDPLFAIGYSGLTYVRGGN